MNTGKHEHKIVKNGSGYQVTPDIICLPIVMVNVILAGDPSGSSNEWVLIDAGLSNSSGKIIDAAKEYFGDNIHLKAIILTHGHFDHVGSLKDLLDIHDVPVYAHELELPYITGKSDYPPPDPTVGGGLMARLSPMYPNSAIDIGGHAHALPSDGSVPSMPGWRWIHTPGHTPGHVSLFRDSDKLLIAGDAFITVNQESAIDVLTQNKEVNGPPAYFTTDWQQAKKSVRILEDLNPHTVIAGHGIPLSGEKLEKELERLAQDFDKLAVPGQGRYVDN